MPVGPRRTKGTEARARETDRTGRQYGHCPQSQGVSSYEAATSRDAPRWPKPDAGADRVADAGGKGRAFATDALVAIRRPRGGPRGANPIAPSTHMRDRKRGEPAVSSPIRAAARRLPGASCGPACASPGRCSRPGDPARLLRPWQRKRASAASDEQSDRQLSAGASRQTGPQLTSSTDSDSDLTRCAVREGSIPARTESGRPVWGMGRIRDSCAKRLLCVQAGRVERVRGAPDWLVVRGSSLFGLHAIKDEMPSQFGLGSLVRDRTDRVTVSKGRRLSCPGLSESGPGDPRGGANGTG